MTSRRESMTEDTETSMLWAVFEPATSALARRLLNYMRNCMVVIPEYEVLNELCFWTLSIVWCLKNKQN
jgi:hypothetical protein